MTDMIEILAALGDRLAGFGADDVSRRAIARAVEENPWFTPREIVYAVEAIRERMLDDRALRRFAGRYPISVAALAPATITAGCERRPASRGLTTAELPPSADRQHAARDEPAPVGELAWLGSTLAGPSSASAATAHTVRNVGVIMAGNIPLVGFYDMLCVLLAGHNCIVKPSSKDRALTEYIIGLLREIEPDIPIFPFEGPIDALIATGSDNTNRYFRAEYPGIPSILRSTRHSVAILQGDESARQLAALAQDVFLYSGLGCRSVSRIFIPVDYDLQRLCDALRQYEPNIDPKLRNSYLQRRAILIMNGVEITDGGFFVVRESGAMRETGGGGGQSEGCAVGVGDDFPTSPGEIAVTRYDGFARLNYLIERFNPQPQCIVADSFPHRSCVPFGMAQRPGLDDFPDGVDVVSFLTDTDMFANQAE